MTRPSGMPSAARAIAAGPSGSQEPCPQRPKTCQNKDTGKRFANGSGWPNSDEQSTATRVAIRASSINHCQALRFVSAELTPSIVPTALAPPRQPFAGS